MMLQKKMTLLVGTLAFGLCTLPVLAQTSPAAASLAVQAPALPTPTALQKAATKLSSDLDQALSQSNFDALARQSIREQAIVLVQAADQLASGVSPKHKAIKGMHEAEKKLLNAFSTGLFEVDQAAQLNLDLADYQDAAKPPHKKHHWGL